MYIMFIVFISANYTNLDYENYEATYSNLLVGHTTEWLYTLLRVFFLLKIKCSYDIFRLIITTLGVILFKISIDRYLKNNKYYYTFLILFLIFPFFWDIPVHRNFLASTLLFFSLRFLEHSSLKNILLFIFTIICAAGIQASFLLYLPLSFVFILKSHEKFNLSKKIIYVLIFITFLATFTPGFILSHLQKYLVESGDDRLNYIETIQTNYGYLQSMVEQLSLFYIGHYAYKYICKKGERDHIKNTDFKIIEISYYIFIVCIMFCPFYRIQGNFVRLLYNQVPILFLQYACILPYCTNNRTVLMFLRPAVWGICIILSLLVFIPHWNDIILPAFTNNWIIELL